jgi:Arm DNA-binding domain
MRRYRQSMGKSTAKSINEALQTWNSLAAADGLVVPGNPLDSGTLQSNLGAYDGHMVPERRLPGNRACLDGNLVCRKLPKALLEYVIWDTELAGFGLRVRPSGRRSWFVRVRRRGKHQRITLGATEDVDAATVRARARCLLAEVGVDPPWTMSKLWASPSGSIRSGSSAGASILRPAKSCRIRNPRIPLIGNSYQFVDQCSAQRYRSDRGCHAASSCTCSELIAARSLASILALSGWAPVMMRNASAACPTTIEAPFAVFCPCLRAAASTSVSHGA